MTYRIGNHQPQNVYRDDRYIGVMFSPIDAAAVVRHMNRVETCDCETYEPCNGECCGVGMCSCSPEPIARTPDVDHARGAAEGWNQAINVLLDVAIRTDSPAAGWAAAYLTSDPDRLGPREDAPSASPSAPLAAEQPSVGGSGRPGPHGGAEDSCTCSFLPGGADPACPAHQPPTRRRAGLA